MTEAALCALDCNYLEASRIFVAFSRRGEYVERRGVAIASCGLPVEDLNWGFLKPPHDDLPATSAAVRDYFTARKLPFRLVYRGDQRASVRGLEGSGWTRKSDPVPGMSLALPAKVPAPPSALAIEEVHSLDELVAFREAAFQGFGYPVSAAKHFLDERLLALPRVRFFSGLVGGAVVATSMLVATGAVGGIYWVATLEGHRGRGYGEALTWAAVAAGQELGCEVASLQASKMGRPVYARMGFSQVLDYEYLHPAQS